MTAAIRSSTAATCCSASPVNDNRSASRASRSDPVQRQPLVGGQPVEQIVLHLALLPHGQGHRDRVLLDHLVRGLPADAGPDRGDQHLGGGQERQVALQFPVDDGRVGAEIVEHRQERLEQPVDRVERIRQRDPADHRAEDVALVPLRTGQLAGHRGVAAQDHRQPADPFAGAGIHLVRHRR